LHHFRMLSAIVPMLSYNYMLVFSLLSLWGRRADNAKTHTTQPIAGVMIGTSRAAGNVCAIMERTTAHNPCRAVIGVDL